ncbi:hypothetical protein [Stutzerimonas zhaodongensis]|uniref:hypothetical protein n=1 Tax=Stutzerimonas zhaodongensis TaxID=1176257 RepID=UPI002104BC07|nr:hypothetical protein [Stutzerimonas zhaodongensis]MCQ2029038.1 hypothetical protein [Stutzerimonas zhaodongensis]
MTKEQIIEARRAIEWKANLYALAAELLAEAEAGDPLSLRIVQRVGLTEPLRLVTTEDNELVINRDGRD